eukprot:TRINITY_DN668_c0_g1_i1.p1 TRINITY_DN668_c0_g1~~TRINITY_DN668_c0_g1_i1.p1  ORF type:complete len:385 (+),score=124.24 TRINITY_DN668_c0_g1_i1:80-1234(+)
MADDVPVSPVTFISPSSNSIEAINSGNPFPSVQLTTISQIVPSFSYASSSSSSSSSYTPPPSYGTSSSYSASSSSSLSSLISSPMIIEPSNVTALKLPPIIGPEVETDPSRMTTTVPPILNLQNAFIRDITTNMHKTKVVVKQQINNALSDTMQYVARSRTELNDHMNPSDILTAVLRSDEKIIGIPLEFRSATVNGVGVGQTGELPALPKSAGWMFLTDSRVLLLSTTLEVSARIRRFLGQEELVAEKQNMKASTYEVTSEASESQWIFPISIEQFHHFYMTSLLSASATDKIVATKEGCCCCDCWKGKRWDTTAHNALFNGEKKSNLRVVVFALHIPPWSAKANLVIDVSPSVRLKVIMDWLSAFQTTLSRCGKKAENYSSF